MDLFDEWSALCNVNGTMNFHATVYFMAAEMVTAGEIFARRRWRRKSDGLAVPLQIQTLDSELCDWGKTAVVDGGTAINGIEYDPIGRRRGYWLHPNNPVGFWPILGGNNASKFVPAEDVIHLFEPRGNQQRGTPWMSNIITDLREVKDYEIAEGVRKKTEACLVGVVIPDSSSDDPNIGLDETDGNGAVLTDSMGNPVNQMTPGMLAVMRNGGDIKFNSPAIVAGVEAYLRTRYRQIAAGSRMPYELLTNDYSQANFASGQLGLIDYERFIDAMVWHVIIPQCAQRLWDWFIEAAKFAGKIPPDLKVKVEWQPQEFERINRLDNSRADLLDVRMGKRSLPEVISKTGRTPSEVLKENDEYLAAVDKTASGMVLDSDPRKVSLNGQAQIFGNNSQGDGEGAAGS